MNPSGNSVTPAPLQKSLKAILGGEAKDASVFMAANFLRRFGGFFLVPLYMRRLTPEDYGVLAIIAIIGSFQGIASTLSIELSVTRFYYEWPEADRRRNLGAIWTWNWVLTFACTGLFLFGLPIATPYLFPEAQFFPYLALGVISNALGDLFVVPSSTIRIRRMPWLFAGYSFASFACTTGLGVWFVVIQNQGLTGYLTASIASSALTALFGAVVMLGVARPCLTAPGLREAFRFALPAAPSSLVSIVGSVLDRFLLNYFATLETLGLYSVAMKFVDLIGSGIHPSLKMTYGPFMMKQFAENKETGKTTVTSITPFYLLPYFAAGLGLIFFIDPFVRFVDRPAYFAIVTWVPWLVGIAILSNLYFYYTNGMFLANRTDLLFVPAAAQLAVLVIACALLIPAHQLAGLVASRYLSAIAFLGLSLYLSQKVFPLPHKWGALIALAAAAVGFALLGSLVHLDNLYLEAALKLPLLLAFLGGAYWFLSREQRNPGSQP